MATTEIICMIAALAAVGIAGALFAEWLRRGRIEMDALYERERRANHEEEARK